MHSMWETGTTVFGLCILSVNFRVLIITNVYNGFNLLVFAMSYVLYVISWKISAEINGSDNYKNFG